MNYINNYPCLIPSFIAASIFVGERAVVGALGLGALGLGKLANYLDKRKFFPRDFRLANNNDEIRISNILIEKAFLWIKCANRDGEKEKQIVIHLLSIGLISETSLSILFGTINNIPSIFTSSDLENSIELLQNPAFNIQNIRPFLLNSQNFTVYLQNSTPYVEQIPHTLAISMPAIESNREIESNGIEISSLNSLLTSGVLASLATRTALVFLGVSAKAISYGVKSLSLESVLDDYASLDITGDALICLAKKNMVFEAHLLQSIVFGKTVQGMYNVGKMLCSFTGKFI